MNSQETIALLLEQGIEAFTAAVDSTPDDKFDWKPEPTARTAREVACEIVVMFIKTVKNLETRTLDTEYMSYMEELLPLSRAELITKAKDSLVPLTAAIKAFPTEELEVVIPSPWGDMTFFEQMSYAYWNMMYHTGQINYIQTLYGDKDMH